jgi:hypothetical protein
VPARPPRWRLPSRIYGAFQPEAPYQPVHDISRRARSTRRLAHSEDLRNPLCVSGGRPADDREFCFRGPSHSVHGPRFAIMATSKNEPLTCIYAEPPIGIEPMTYALREVCSLASDALAALMARGIALTASAALGLSGDPVSPRTGPRRRPLPRRPTNYALRPIILSRALNLVGPSRWRVRS